MRRYGLTNKKIYTIIIDSCMRKPTLKKLLEGELCYEENRKKFNYVELCICGKFDYRKYCIK